MKTNLKEGVEIGEGSRPAGAEQRLKEAGIKSPCRLVYGVASLPLGTPVELEIILEVAG